MKAETGQQRAACLGVRVQPPSGSGAHAGAVVCRGAADALGHVHAVSTLATAHAVMLGAAEMASLAGELRQWSLCCTPAGPANPTVVIQCCRCYCSCCAGLHERLLLPCESVVGRMLRPVHICNTSAPAGIAVVAGSRQKLRTCSDQVLII